MVGNRKLASEDLSGGLWATRRDPAATFSALYWNRVLSDTACYDGQDVWLGSGYRSELKSATRKAGRRAFRQVEQAQSLDTGLSTMTLPALMWRLGVYMGQPSKGRRKRPSELEVLTNMFQAMRVLSEILSRLIAGEQLPVPNPAEPAHVGREFRPLVIPEKLQRELKRRARRKQRLCDQPWWKTTGVKKFAGSQPDGLKDDPRVSPLAVPLSDDRTPWRAYQRIDISKPWSPENVRPWF